MQRKIIFSFNFNWIFQLVRALENEVYSLSVILKGNDVIKKGPLYIILNYVHAQCPLLEATLEHQSCAVGVFIVCLSSAVKIVTSINLPYLQQGLMGINSLLLSSLGLNGTLPAPLPKSHLICS